MESRILNTELKTILCLWMLALESWINCQCKSYQGPTKRALTPEGQRSEEAWSRHHLFTTTLSELNQHLPPPPPSHTPSPQPPLCFTHTARWRRGRSRQDGASWKPLPPRTTLRKLGSGWEGGRGVFVRRFFLSLWKTVSSAWRVEDLL